MKWKRKGALAVLLTLLLSICVSAAPKTVIPGGNHAGFGSYGAQEGDRAAAISQREQVQQTAAAIAAFAAGS